MTDAFLADRNGTRLNTVAVGDMNVYIQVEFQTTGIPAGASYDIRTSTGGRTNTNTVTLGAGGIGTQNQTFGWGTYLVQPGSSAFTATVDVNNAIVETDESDNGRATSYSGVVPPFKFQRPLEGTEWVDWSIGNYNDVDAEDADDGGFDGPATDYRGGQFVYDGHDAWDIGVDNWKSGYAGVDIYAAAAGTVESSDDVHYDHNTEALHQPVNFVKIDHGGGWKSVYLHLRRDSITAAGIHDHMPVVAGEKIGLMGSSGHSTGLHVHWGVTYNGRPVEPMLSPSGYLSYPLGYSGDNPSVLGIGTTSYTLTTEELTEGPTDISTFSSVNPGQTATVWARLAGIESDDVSTVRWYRNSNLQAQSTFQAHNGYQTASNPVPIGATGDWRVEWWIKNELKGTTYFVQQGSSTAQARITKGSEYVADGRTTPFDFGDIVPTQLNNPIPTMTFTVSNVGFAALTTSGFSLPAGFSLVSGSSLATSIAPGASDSFTVQLNNTTPGHKQGFVAFVTNDPSPGELLQTFAIEGDVYATAGEAITGQMDETSKKIDTVYLRRNGSNSDIWINRSTNLSPSYTFPISALSGLTFDTLEGDDSVVVDYINGTPFNSSMSYDGGTGSNYLYVLGSAGADSVVFAPGETFIGFSVVNHTNVASFETDLAGGNDTILLGASGGNDLDLLGTNFSIRGDAGSDQLTINDSEDIGLDVYTLAGNTVHKTGFDLNYLTMETITLQANGDANTLNVNSTLADTTLILNGNGGIDTVYVGSGDLDADILGTLQVNGGAGSDTLVFNDQTDLSTFIGDLYSITSTTFSKTDFPAVSWGGSASFENLVVNANNDADIINVTSVAAAQSVVIYAGGDIDVIAIGSPGDQVSAVDGPVVVNGGAGVDRLDYNDSANDFAVLFPTYTLTSNTIARTNAGQVSYGTVETVIVNAGLDGDQIDITGTTSGVTRTVNGGGGSDTFNIGSPGDSVSAVDGALTINGGAGANVLNYNDGANLVVFPPDTYTITGTTISRTGSAVVTYAAFSTVNINASSAQNVFNIALANASAFVTVNGSGGADVFNINSTYSGVTEGFTLTLNGGEGDDTFNLTPLGDNLSSLAGTVVVRGDNGTDSAIFHDTAFAANAIFSVSSLSVGRNGSQGTLYNTLEHITIRAGTGADTFNVNSTAANVPVQIEAGAGNDTLNANSTAGGAQVLFNSGSNDDIVNANTDGGVDFAQVDLIETPAIGLAALNIGSAATVRLVPTILTDPQVLVTRALTIIGLGVLDIRDKAAIIDYLPGPSPLPAIKTALTIGYAGGAWNGSGINSAVAAATPQHALGYAEATDLFTVFPASFAGQSIDNSAVLIRYTRYGDANLDQIVNLADFNRLATSFGQTNTRWAQGNSNFDLFTNLSDFNLLASSFGLSASPGVAPAALGSDASPRFSDVFIAVERDAEPAAA